MFPIQYWATTKLLSGEEGPISFNIHAFSARVTPITAVA